MKFEDAAGLVYWEMTGFCGEELDFEREVMGDEYEDTVDACPTFFVAEPTFFAANIKTSEPVLAAKEEEPKPPKGKEDASSSKASEAGSQGVADL